MLVFGTKLWFQNKDWASSSKESVEKFKEIFLSLSKEIFVETDIQLIHKSYNSVKSARVAYLHRKEQRLAIKDEIMKGLDSFHPSKNKVLEKLEGDAIAKYGSDPEYQELIDGIAEMISSYFIFKEIDDNIPCDIVLVDELLKLGLTDGRLYQPPAERHTWLTNVSWVLAHIHKKSKFLICSEVSEEYLYRKTKEHQNQISGFAREIAVLRKLGYRIEITNGIISMEPSEQDDSLISLTLHDVILTKEEFIAYYREVIHEISELKSKQKRQVPTTYVYRFKSNIDDEAKEGEILFDVKEDDNTILVKIYGSEEFLVPKDDPAYNTIISAHKMGKLTEADIQLFSNSATPLNKLIYEASELHLAKRSFFSGRKKQHSDELLLQLALWFSLIGLQAVSQERNLFSLHRLDNFSYTIGDCMFDSIAALVPNHGNGIAIRNLVVSYFKQDMQLRARITALAGAQNTRIRTVNGDQIYEDFNGYVRLMSKSGSWGTELELVALARRLSQPIVILTPSNIYDQIVEEPAYAQGIPIFLNYVGNNHYEPLTFVLGTDPKTILEEIRTSIAQRQQQQQIVDSQAPKSK